MIKDIFKSKSFKDTIVYVSSIGINKLSSFAFLPILAFFLLPADIGAFTLFRTSYLFIMPLVSLQVASIISRDYFTAEKSAFKTEYFSSIVLAALVTMGCIVVLLVLALFDARAINLPAPIIWLIPLVSFFYFVNTLLLTYMRVARRALEYGVIDFIRVFGEYLFVLLLIFFCGKNYIYAIIGVVIANFFSFIFSFYRASKVLVFDFKIKWDTVSYLFKQALPLVPHAIGGIIINSSDKYVVDYILGKEQLGVYSLAYNFGMAINIVVSTVGMLYTPWLYSQLSAKVVNKQRIKKVIYLLFGAIAVLSGILLVTVNLLSGWVNIGDYGAIYHIVPFIVVGYTFFGFYSLLYPILIYYKKNFGLSKITFSIGLLSTVITYFFTLSWGILGAAIATTISFIMLFLVVFWSSNKTSRIFS